MSKVGRRSPKGEYTPRDHYMEVTNQIIAALEAGTPPWRKPWDPGKAGTPGMPCNAVTGIRYRGINVVTLATSPLALAGADPRWATYKQAADRGWQVKKGARGTTAYFFKRVEVSDPRPSAERDEKGKTRHIPLLRAFTLFHASQIESIPEFAPPTAAEAPWRASDAAESLVTNSGVTVRIGGDRAFYALGTDHIQCRRVMCSLRQTAGTAPCSTSSGTPPAIRRGSIAICATPSGHPIMPVRNSARKLPR